MATFNLDAAKKKYLRARKAYYNGSGESIMTDAEYDSLEDRIRKADPKWPELKKTGVAVADRKAKVKLAHFMPSLGKAYPDQVERALAKLGAGKRLVMDKLDGSSLYLKYLGGLPVQLITRGNGEIGQDITFLIPDLRLPQIKDQSKIEFRCEGVVSRKNFAKWENDFENSRQMVAGLLNRKKSSEPHPGMQDIDIVVLGMFGCDISWALPYAKSLGLKVVANKIAPSNVGASQASAFLKVRKAKSPYEIDGLVVTNVGTRMIYEDSDKPKWAFAFKENAEEEAPETKVVKVVYQVTQHRRIIPKIEIKPVRLDGATVTYATCHNAKWLKDRKIGPGAIVKVLRSGGVIPKIVAVVKPGKFQAPDVPYKMDGVHFVLDGESTDEVESKVQEHVLMKFLREFGIEGVANKTVALLLSKGCSTPFHYMKLAQGRSVEPLQRAGLGPVQSAKLLAELVRVFGTPVDLLTLMVASNSFGVGLGERKFMAIRKAGVPLGSIVSASTKAKVRELLASVPGFQDKTIRMVIAGIPAFRKFLATAERFITVEDRKPPKAKKKAAGPLSGESVSWTGYRSDDEEEAVEAAGGDIVSFSVSRTTILLVGGKGSTKADKARAAGIRVCSFCDLNLKL